MSLDSSQARPEILAALLWDVPALRGFEAKGGADFLESFSPGPLTLRAPEGTAPLSIAAAGVVADRLGRDDVAVASFDQLGADGWERILRLCLRAWSSSLSSVEDLEAASQAVADIADATLQARLRSKLATYAYDKGDGERFEAELRAAAGLAPEGSRLRATLLGESYNYLGDGLSWEQWQAESPPDPLVSHPWISTTGRQAAVDHLTDLVEDRARGPWSVSFKIGRGPLDEALAAEVQATWAGALWLRRDTRLQLGSQMLLSGPSDPHSAAEALRYWILGGGSKISTVGQLVEPFLDRDALGWLVDALASRPGRLDVTETELAQVATLFWDSVPDNQLEPLLDRLPLQPGNHPKNRAVRELWSLLLLRVPDAWTTRFSRASSDAQAALLEELDAAKIERLPAEAARRLLELADTENVSQRNPLLIRVLLARNVTGSPPDDLALAPATAAQRAELAEALGMFLKGTEEALPELANAVTESRKDAHQGKVGFGGRSAAQTLAAVLTLPEAPSVRAVQPYIDSLWESALDERLVSRLRLEALAGLAHLALEDRLGEDRVGDLRRTALDTLGEFEVFDAPATPDLLGAAVLLVLAGAGKLTDDEEVALLWRSRSPDARARELAINACGLGLRYRASSLLSQVIFSGLFDGEEGVVARALQEINRASLIPTALDDLVVGRLLELLRTRRRRVRVACAQLAFARHGEDERYERVLEAAAADKSWQVQQAARGGY